MTGIRRTDAATAPLPFDAAGTAAEAIREKSPQAFRTISEVGEELDIPAHVLRFWETKFPQLNPMKRGGGRRYYRPADVALLKGIRVALYDEGLTIKGLQKLFRERGPRYIAGLGEGQKLDDLPRDIVETPEPAGLADDNRLPALIAELEHLRDRLRGA
jgi:DNA-binding transcriptional MerR regulator